MSNVRSDMETLPGRLLFPVLTVPMIPPGGNKKRYSLLLQVSKDAPEFQQLMETIERVAIKTWGEQQGAENLGKYQAAIKNGMEPKYSPISIRDGDLFDPQYNAGFWLIQATRRDGQGPPQIRGLDGQPVEHDEDLPKSGDGVLVLVNVWAQPAYDRMNFSLEAVRKIIDGEPVGGPPTEVIAAGVEALEKMAVPRSLPGVKPVAGALAASAGPRAAAPTNSPGAKPAAIVRDAEIVPEETAPAESPRRRGLMKL